MCVCLLTFWADSGPCWDCGSADWKTEKRVPRTTATESRSSSSSLLLSYHLHITSPTAVTSWRHPCCSEMNTLASSSCVAMKFSWLMFTRSKAVTTVTMRFSRRPTRLPTSSSSLSLASCQTTQDFWKNVDRQWKCLLNLVCLFFFFFFNQFELVAVTEKRKYWSNQF